MNKLVNLTNSRRSMKEKLETAKAKIMSNDSAKKVIEQAKAMYDGTTESVTKAVTWASGHIQKMFPDIAHTILTGAVILLVVQGLGLAVVTVKTMAVVLSGLVGILVIAYILQVLIGILLVHKKKADETKAAEAVPAPAAVA